VLKGRCMRSLIFALLVSSLSCSWVVAQTLVAAYPADRAAKSDTQSAGDQSASARRTYLEDAASRAARGAVKQGKAAPDFGIAEVATINQEIRKGWADHSLVPSKAATDGEWCRRVYLDLIGRVPTVKELHQYEADRGRDPSTGRSGPDGKRAKLVDRLLGEEYSDAYAANWTTVWTNLLIGRTGGTERRSLTVRDGMREYLSEAMRYNKPYDQLATELITATGSCQPGDEDFNGAANFLADKMEEGGVQATAKTSQIFLGMAVQCTQCHDHPFNEVKQNQFWELNAFFRQTAVERVRAGDNRRDDHGRVVNRDFRGEGGDFVKAEIYYELRNGKMKVAYPVFVDGQSLAAKYAAKGEDFGDRGWLEDVNRREELAQMVVASREFDRAMVNRLWAHFLGYGFVKPLDDMRPDNPPSHPELVDALGADFRDAGFDLKKLMRWIVLSEPYSLSSRMTSRNADDDPALGARPMFSRFYLRQMQAEQLYESLLVATAADSTLSKDERADMRDRWLRQFTTAFGTDENDEATTFNGSIPQALTLMNGDLVRRATGNEKGSMLYRVAWDEQMNNPAKIRYLYEAALSRVPTRQELAISNELLVARQGNVGAALQDIWWALLNTNEFILIH
jgi:hypothetical protein